MKWTEVLIEEVWLKSLVLFVALISMDSLVFSNLSAQDRSGSPMTYDPFSAKGVLFETMRSSAESVFEDRAVDMEALWDRLEQEEEARWEKLEKKVLEKWDRYLPTTQKVWVDYSPDKTAVSQVDFEEGKVLVEALVPKSASHEEAQTAVSGKLKALVTAEDGAGAKVMEGMLSKEQESSISAGEVDVEHVETIQGRDGVQRKKVSVTLEMVPDHIKKRAEKFFPNVQAEAEASHVDPALAMAVIQTESAFNPKARSHIPAFGLMQIVPRYAGKEAYFHLYNQEKLLSPEYLYNPENNIKIGITYLKLLAQKYFSDIVDSEKRRFVVVCAYNWGPTAMRKRLLVKLQYDEIGREELFKVLLEGVPEETHNYLKRVEQRRVLYSGEVH